MNFIISMACNKNESGVDDNEDIQRGKRVSKVHLEMKKLSLLLV